mmetsp:Transcript_14651/g.55186  ORF Transcript_14651/g.55186 Transcript_14651/m.55186 type:complete len:216 (+) Transcript_14651:707-1354(+)
MPLIRPARRAANMPERNVTYTPSHVMTVSQPYRFHSSVICALVQRQPRIRGQTGPQRAASLAAASAAAEATSDALLGALDGAPGEPLLCVVAPLPGGESAASGLAALPACGDSRGAALSAPRDGPLPLEASLLGAAPPRSADEMARPGLAAAGCPDAARAPRTALATIPPPNACPPKPAGGAAHRRPAPRGCMIPLFDASAAMLDALLATTAASE